jgi:hypothetical protein
LHNLILEDKRNNNLLVVGIPNCIPTHGQQSQADEESIEFNMMCGLTFQQYQRGYVDVRDMKEHFNLNL